MGFTIDHVGAQNLEPLQSILKHGDTMTVKMKDVYAINDRGEGQKHASWAKIGVAFVNRDDSINVILDAVPLTGKLNIRDRKPKDEPTQSRQER
jgi:hypothetical protein